MPDLEHRPDAAPADQDGVVSAGNPPQVNPNTAAGIHAPARAPGIGDHGHPADPAIARWQAHPLEARARARLVGRNLDRPAARAILAVEAITAVSSIAAISAIGSICSILAGVTRRSLLTRRPWLSWGTGLTRISRCSWLSVLPVANIVDSRIRFLALGRNGRHRHLDAAVGTVLARRLDLYFDGRCRRGILRGGCRASTHENCRRGDNSGKGSIHDVGNGRQVSPPPTSPPVSRSARQPRGRHAECVRTPRSEPARSA